MTSTVSISIKPKKYLNPHLFLLLPVYLFSNCFASSGQPRLCFFFWDRCFSSKERITEIRIGLVMLLALLVDKKQYFLQKE